MQLSWPRGESRDSWKETGVEVLTAVTLKVIVSWNVMSCIWWKVIVVSEEHNASVFGVVK
jgi:hypothetical protein